MTERKKERERERKSERGVGGGREFLSPQVFLFVVATQGHCEFSDIFL